VSPEIKEALVNVASCPNTVEEALLKVPDFTIEFTVPEAVNVCSIVLELVPAECVLVVASALENPDAASSCAREVSDALGFAVSVVTPTYPKPLVPADVLL